MAETGSGAILIVVAFLGAIVIAEAAPRTDLDRAVREAVARQYRVQPKGGE